MVSTLLGTVGYADSPLFDDRIIELRHFADRVVSGGSFMRKTPAARTVHASPFFHGRRELFVVRRDHASSPRRRRHRPQASKPTKHLGHDIEPSRSYLFSVKHTRSREARRVADMEQTLPRTSGLFPRVGEPPRESPYPL